MIFRRIKIKLGCRAAENIKKGERQKLACAHPKSKGE